jgi:hypothetical protein
MRRLALFLSICGILAAPSALGQPGESRPPDAKALITAAVLKDIRGFLSTPIVSLSVKAQNERHKAIKQDEITKLDRQWVEERKGADKPLIAATLSSPLSVYLLRTQAGSLGLYSELFVTDAHGLNVGQSSITSDYWQGDEAKFKKTFLVAPDAVFIDDPEFHKESKTWRAQVNLTVADPQTKAAIGAATVELNLTELMRRAAETN